LGRSSLKEKWGFVTNFCDYFRPRQLAFLLYVTKISRIGQVKKTHFSSNEGFFEQEEEQLYEVVLKLWPIGEVVLEELHFLPKINCGMILTEEKNDHPLHFYKHEQRETLIFDETANITIKNKKFVG
jgi:hypothetical protein